MKHVVHAIALVALASSALAFDPPEGCEVPEVECEGIPYLEPNTSWLPTGEPDWKPNRMPAAWINLRPGEYCSYENGNFRGLQPWWYDQDDDPGYDGDGTNVLNDLESKLTESYNHGFRRFILNLPAGMVYPQNMAGSQWWSMPQWKREGLACVIQNWLASKPDTQFEIYSAFQLNDPNSLCMENNAYAEPTLDDIGDCDEGEEPGDGMMMYPCSGADDAYTPSAFIQADVCAFHTNIHPWQYLGITRYWLDWSSHWWDYYVEFPYCPLYAPGSQEHHFLGAEAIPIELVNSAYEIDEDKAFLSPAIGIDVFFPTFDADRSWDISADWHRTEIVTVLDHTNNYFLIDNMSGVLAWTQRGIVLACQGVANIGSDPPGAEAVAAGKLIEYMKRVYDFGSIDGRDFNGDGLINATDVSDYNAAYALYGGKTTGCNWAHGDMNQDNDVDSSDQILYNHRRMSLFPVTINLGTAEPNDALTK